MTIHIVNQLEHFFNWAYRLAGTSTNPSAFCQISFGRMLAALAQHSISEWGRGLSFFTCFRALWTYFQVVWPSWCCWFPTVAAWSWLPSYRFPVTNNWDCGLWLVWAVTRLARICWSNCLHGLPVAAANQMQVHFNFHFNSAFDIYQTISRTSKEMCDDRVVHTGKLSDNCTDSRVLIKILSN